MTATPENAPCWHNQYRPREICSNVRQVHEIIGMVQMCYHTNHCTCWPCFVNMRVFICYKTEKGTPPEGGGGVQGYFKANGGTLH